jgi:hypothetical protein
MSYTIENEMTRVIFEANGTMLSLVNKRSGTELVKPHGLWRLIINEGEALEVELRAENASGTVRLDGDSFRISYKNPVTHTGNVKDIGVVVAGKMDGEDLQLEITLTNNMKDSVIRECHFPIVNLSDEAANMTYYTSYRGGVTTKCLNDQRYSVQEGAAHYKFMDYIYQRKINKYPGTMASTNCMALGSGVEGLYFGCHDLTFTFTDHMLELEQRENLNLTMVKTPFVHPGKQHKIATYYLSAYSGKWHRAADKYRKWAETWYDFKPVPKKVQEMQGWQRLIMRSQYGENFYTFDQLPQINEDGMKAGIDTLFMFGWHEGGHDCDYPNYTPAEGLGGKTGLKKNIKKFQDAGGKVILYANGQLIDKNSDFYQSGKGAKLCIKNHRGHELLDFYGFGGRGIFNREYGNRTFVTACPSSRIWRNELKKVIDRAAELGCNGVFFDQLGGNAFLCCDPGHDHPVPYTGFINARSDMVAELKAYTTENYPEMSFGIEILSDITAQHADYVHTLAGGSAVINSNWEENGVKPEVAEDLRWFRYIFPEVILTNREIRDDTDIERRVNRMLMQNLRSDVEIYRCQKTIAETPHYQAYLGKANAFREKHGKLLFYAKYRADSLHETDNLEIDAEDHLAADGSVVVMATQSHLDSTVAKITVPGYTLSSHDFFGDGELQSDGSVKIGKHGLALLKFVKA